MPARAMGFVPWAHGAGEPVETPSPPLTDRAANQLKMLIRQTNIYTVSLTVAARGCCGKKQHCKFL